MLDRRFLVLCRENQENRAKAVPMRHGIQPFVTVTDNFNNLEIQYGSILSKTALQGVRRRGWYLGVTRGLIVDPAAS